MDKHQKVAAEGVEQLLAWEQEELRRKAIQETEMGIKAFFLAEEAAEEEEEMPEGIDIDVSGLDIEL
jgi:hypothetical protein